MGDKVGKSRLEKLFHLLESGSSLATRQEAGRQIAEIAKTSPQQLPTLQRKLLSCLGSNVWESRVAAGDALGRMAEHFQQPTVDTIREAAGLQGERAPSPQGASEGGSMRPEPIPVSFSLDTFNMRQVLERGTPLLASAGEEYDRWEEQLSAATSEDRLERQRTNLRKRLGLGDGMNSFMDTKDLIADEDLIASSAPETEIAGKEAALQLLDEMAGGLSARERNKLKRKAKSASSKETGIPEFPGAGGARQIGPGQLGTAEKSPAVEAQLVEDDLQEWREVCSGRWIFQRLADHVCEAALHPRWQVRHGAAIALREVLRSQAGSAGVSVNLPKRDGASFVHASELSAGMQSAADAAEAEKANKTWLHDCVIRMLCVLALDRFGDYVSDQVVAPVRETAAQALGAAMQALPVSSLKAVMQLLGQLKGREEWQVRHGCALGWKYLLASRRELAPQLLPMALPPLMQGLKDKDDDVRAAAAEALLPVTDALLASGLENVRRLREILWDILLELQELSSSTASVMHLLAQLYSDPKCAGDKDQLTSHIPRLWPFLRHTLKPVRMAVLACIQGILEAEEGKADWLTPILGQAASLIYQNLVLEEDCKVLDSSVRLFRQLLLRSPPQALIDDITPEIAVGWATLAATAPGARLDRRLMVDVVPGGGNGTQEQQLSKRARLQAERERAAYGGDRICTPPAGDPAGNRARAAAADALGALGATWQTALRSNNPASAALTKLLQTGSATARQVAGMTMSSWMANQGTPEALSWMLDAARNLLQETQASAPTPGSSEPYAELTPHYKQLRADVASLMSHPHVSGSPILMSLPEGWSIDGAAPEDVVRLGTALVRGPWSATTLGPRCSNILSMIGAVQQLEALLHSAAQAALADAIVSSAALPPKLNTLVQPLMGALRREPDPLLSARAGSAIAHLALLCVNRKPSPNAKVVINICNMACSDRAVTPDAAAAEADPDEEPLPGLPGAGPAVDGADRPLSPEAVARGGAEAALKSFAESFGNALLEGLPKLWEFLALPLIGFQAGEGVGPQLLINAMQVLSVVGPATAGTPWKQCLGLLPALGKCCQHERAAVRSMAARGAAALASSHTMEVMPILLRLLVPMLSSTIDNARRGAAEALSELVSTLRAKLAAYTVLLLVPLLGRMADPLAGIRRSATLAFANLVEMLPLSQGLPAPDGIDEAQLATWQQDSCLLEQLLDNRKSADYMLPPGVTLSVNMRPYQQEGINWLAFLRKFGLHGVLADDMGLGKTLQAIAITAAAVCDNVKDAAAGKDPVLPCLIVCPPTLVGHWATEISRFLGAEGPLRPLRYEGTSIARSNLQPHWESGCYNVIIMSYESCRCDIHWLEPQRWLYAILDEGHIIKNAKTKVSRAVKRLAARHRLVLSGTPIQNDVLELWSIFDYLMPGFLGSERQFNSRFRRAVQVAKASKKGSKELEQGLLAADSLHKAVMPFVLRRTKDQVLKDLPPKIIQDVYCSMSPLQVSLYDHFSHSNAASEIREGLSSISTDAAPHVFQAMQYLRKLCSHPALAIDPRIKEHREALQRHCGLQDGAGWEQEMQEQSLSHAPKLQALKDILCQCQIGNYGDSADDDDMTGEVVGAGHRILIFAQLRSLLDLVQRDLLEPGGVSFLRLDGSVPANKRFEVAQQFNADPTIDVLLLTTSVGGLGLNLTTADTVVFLEHDWNPQKDLQAMDRAHRLGQKRTVNVYRLLMKDTLEEKIMGMQRFKLDVANAVVNTDNVSLKNMDTAQLLDLFTPAKGKPKANAGTSASEDVAAGVGGKGLKAMLAGLEELWDESQYAEEFSLEGFISKLNK